LISKFQITGKIIIERDIAVRPFAQVMAVYPNFAVTVNAIEIDDDVFAF